MATDLTFIYKVKNEASRVSQQFVSDLKKTADEAKRVKAETEKAARSERDLAAQTNRVNSAMRQSAAHATALDRNLGGVVGTLARVAAAVGITRILAAAVTEARKFNAAIAETSTLIEGTPDQVQQLTDASSRLARTYGTTAAEQAKAYYQAISAGAQQGAAATKLLDDANKLAIGGVTDVTTAVDLLTTATNAYGLETLSTTDAANSLFVAVRDGKTTMSELGSTIGRVIPIAKAAGVGFDELNATVATLTTRGVSTAEAVTGVRGILAAIIRPQAQAAAEAKKLGIAFNVAGVAAAGGLIPFLKDLIDKTHGSSTELSKFFQGVEGLAPVLTIASGGLETANKIMGDMKDKAGAAQTAYEKMAASLNQRLSVATANLGDRLRQVGTLLLEVIVPALEAVVKVIDLVAGAFDHLGPTATRVALAIGSIFGVRAVAGVASFLASMTGITSVLTRIIALILGPGGIRLGLVAVASVARFALITIASNPLILLLTTATLLSDKLVKSMQSVQDVAQNVGVAAGAAFQGNGQAVQQEIVRVSNLLAGAKKELAGLEKASILNIGAQERKTYVKGAVAQLEAQLATLQARQKKGVLALPGSQPGDVIPTTPTTPPTVPGTTTPAKQSEFHKLIASTTKALADQRAQATLSAKAFEDYTLKQDLLTAAKKDGLKVSDAEIQKIIDTRNAYQAATVATQTFGVGIQQGFDQLRKQANNVATDAATLVVGSFNAMQQSLTDFFKTGKFGWRDLLSNILGQLSTFFANRLITDFLGLGGGQGAGNQGTLGALGQIFGGGSGGGLGSILGSIFGGAKAAGGPVDPSKAYIVGDGGKPEWFVPNTPGKIVPMDKAGGLGGDNRSFVFQFNLPNVQDVQGFQRSQGQIAANMRRALDRADRRNN